MVLRVIALCCLAATVAAPAVGQPDSLSLQDVEAAYDALDGLKARFTQRVRSDFAADTTQIQGTVLLSGNKYRVETPSQTVVTDGETTWIYTPADSQVVVNNTDQEAATVTPKTFLTASTERYTVTDTSPASRDGRPHTTLRIEATDASSQFRSATLWVRRADRLVTRMVAQDRNGSTIDLRLHEVETSPPLGNEAFTFTPPDGVEVIDLRRSE